MKIGIYGAGDFCRRIDRNIPYIGVDGGIEALSQLGISPIYVVGDFDSLADASLKQLAPYRQLACRKDDTDTAVAIQEAIKMDYTEIALYGVTGGRLDHFMAVCRLLARYKDYRLTIYNDDNCCFLLAPGKHRVLRQHYRYISFFSLDQAIISLDQVAYPLDHYDLRYDDPLCVSNEIIGEAAIVETDGYLYCFQSEVMDTL